MFSKFSVKRPYIVVVAVIIALILGGVSMTRMKTDLFPEMELPYLAVITTDPGSSAEQVEAEITDVLEGNLATVTGVSSVTSQSADNYSMVFLEFEEDTNMDSALVKVSSSVNEVMPLLPDSVGTPNYLEINADMMATMYIAADNSKMDIYELTEFIEDKVAPEFERIDGVADVSVSGGVEQTVEVRLNQEKIDGINSQLTAGVDAEYAEWRANVEAAEADYNNAQADLDQRYANMEASGGRDMNPDWAAQLDAEQADLDVWRADVEAQRADFDNQYNAAAEPYRITPLVEKDTLAQVIDAQNFAMPAGYIDDENDDQWLLRVGENFTSIEALGNLTLTSIEGIGNIRVADVADITIIDNVEDSYVRVSDEPGLILSVFKTSTASTSEVSQSCIDRIDELAVDYPDLELLVVMDQGAFIKLFISSILESMLIGAVLAVIILAIFLLDWKPTVIVAFSIPFSVLCSLIVMNFTGLSLNVITLGGIALAIGMLVDNSIIVLENIYRLRGRGIPAPRAAVQGAKQITGAVVASTLTTVCVFLPVIFTDGLVNQMLVPFALTLTYVLTASLVVALTLVPSVSAFVFKNYVPRRNDWFAKVQDSYARSLDFFLSHKAIPLGVSILLLVAALAGVLSMGVNLMPSMTSKTVTATITMPEDTSKEDAIAMADEVMEAALSIDGVDYVGIMDGSSTLSLVSAAGTGGESSFTQFMLYIQTDDTVTTEAQVTEIVDELEHLTRRLDCEVLTSAASSEEMSAVLGSGLTLRITGADQNVLEELSADIMELVDEVDGYTEISNNMDEAENELQLVINKNELALRGLTVAQVYVALSEALETSADATTIRIDDAAMDVAVVDNTVPFTKESLLNTTLDIDGTKLRLGDIATVTEGLAAQVITHVNSERTMEVTAEIEEGENNALLSRDLQEKLDDYDMPEGYTVEFTGEIDNVNTMLEQMGLMALLGFVLIYLIMVAQFQSLLSPFIVLFTIPLAFTGGFFGLLIMGQQLDILSLMGFLVLMGTVVNNGIVFVDYVNQLRRGGLSKHDALVATGRTRMRPILMTALTTILSMLPLVFSQAVGGSMQRGMAVVVVGGMLYATFMTLYVVPVIYDLLYRKVPLEVDLGDESLDDDPGDAAAYLAELAAAQAQAEDQAAGYPDPRPDAPAPDPAAPRHGK